MQIKLTLPDGSIRKAKKGTTGKELAEEFKLHRMFAMKLDGELRDLSVKLEKDSTLEFIDFSSVEGKGLFWHSAAHVLAQAVIRLFPKARLTIGPPIEDGFYYDIDHDPFTKEDLGEIEAEMKKIVKERLPVERVELTKKKARDLFKDNPFKLEMIEEFSEGLSAYTQGTFIDLCRGPHVPDTGWFKGLKVLKVSGAYWRGDQKNKQLQRIYAIAFPEKGLLKKWVTVREEAKKRDHRRLGRELDLFSVNEKIGPGLPLYHPKGTILRQRLKKLMREQNAKLGFKEVWTPHIARAELWKSSGHYEAFKDKMFIFESDGEEYAIKPMNCPFHSQIFKSKARSYRDLPIGYSEFGTVYRNEKSGELSGLLRVRALTQDDGHLYVRPDQIKEEVIHIVEVALETLRICGLKGFQVNLSTRPDNSVGERSMWEQAEAALKEALESAGVEYHLKEGNGAFYGPKIDIDVHDALNRMWQCSTIQLDFFMPERFDLTYMDEGGKYVRPVMIHRALFGTLDRFLGILIEHYGGKFPLWLAPVQVRILTVSDRFEDYAYGVKTFLEEKEILVEVDARPESVGKKVREAQLQKIPLILTVGEKELVKKTLAVRTLDGKVTFGLSQKKFRDTVVKTVKERSEDITFGK